MATVEFYSKTQVDAKVPDSSAASVGDVLTIGTGGVHEWAAGGGGGGRTITEIGTGGTATASEILTAIENCEVGDKIIGNSLSFNANTMALDFTAECVWKYDHQKGFSITGHGMSSGNDIVSLGLIYNDDSYSIRLTYRYWSTSGYAYQYVYTAGLTGLSGNLLSMITYA